MQIPTIFRFYRYHIDIAAGHFLSRRQTGLSAKQRIVIQLQTRTSALFHIGINLADGTTGQRTEHFLSFQVFLFVQTTAVATFFEEGIRFNFLQIEIRHACFGKQIFTAAALETFHDMRFVFRRRSVAQLRCQLFRQRLNVFAQSVAILLTSLREFFRMLVIVFVLIGAHIHV